MKSNPSIKEQIREVLIDWIGDDYADLDSLMLKLTDIIDSATREAIQQYIEPHLQACRDDNGHEWCKNCGLRPLQEQSEESI